MCVHLCVSVCMCECVYINQRNAKDVLVHVVLSPIGNVHNTLRLYKFERY